MIFDPYLNRPPPVHDLTVSRRPPLGGVLDDAPGVANRRGFSGKETGELLGGLSIQLGMSSSQLTKSYFSEG